jgi:hypothetical protein
MLRCCLAQRAPKWTVRRCVFLSQAADAWVTYYDAYLDVGLCTRQTHAAVLRFHGESAFAVVLQASCWVSHSGAFAGVEPINPSAHTALESMCLHDP